MKTIKPKVFFHLKIVTIVVIAGFCRDVGLAQVCRDVILSSEYKTASAATNKCGFLELCGSSSPAKYYLIFTDTSTGSGSYYWSTTEGRYYYDKASYSVTMTTTVNMTDCSQQTVCSGNAKDSGAVGGTGCPPDGTDDSVRTPPSAFPEVVDCTKWNEIATEIADCTWSPSVDAYNDAVSDVEGDICSDTITTQCDLTMTQTVDTGSCSWGDDYSSGNCSGKTTETETLTSEFTDDMLRGKAISFIPPFPDTWSTNYLGTFGSAIYTLDSAHYTATTGRMEYRFHITNCSLNAKYSITWDELTTYPGGQPPSRQNMQEELEGNGDPILGVYSSVHFRDVPSTQSTVTVENVTLTVLDDGTDSF